MQPAPRTVRSDQGKEIWMDSWSSGREPFPGAGFTFADDAWDLGYRRTRAEAWASDVLKFHQLPDWLKEDAKHHVAHLWLEEGVRNGTLGEALLSLRRLARYVTTHHLRISHVFQLDEAVTTGLTAYFRTLSCSGQRKNMQLNKLARFADWLRVRYQGKPAEFYPEAHEFPWQERPRAYLDGQQWLIPDDVTEQVWRAIRQAEFDFGLDRGTPTKPLGRYNPYTQLLALQLLKLLLATGRRISQLCFLDREPLREPTTYEATGVWVRYTESKTDQGLQEVFVPEPLATEVRKSVEVAQGLTQPHAQGVDYLFLLPAYERPGKRYPPRPVTAVWFRSWLNGDPGIGRPGFLTRYEVRHNGQIYHLKTHQSRHTRLTKIRLGGGAYATAKNDAVHRSETMTGVYLNSLEPVARELRDLHEHRQLLGTLSPLIENKQAQVKELAEDDLALFQEQGMFIQLTAYGYCAQPMENGPCPSGDPCWLGPEGYGCLWHLYGPTARPILERDSAATEAQLKTLREEAPGSPQIGMWQRHLDRLRQMLEEIDQAEGKVCGQ